MVCNDGAKAGEPCMYVWSVLMAPRFTQNKKATKTPIFTMHRQKDRTAAARSNILVATMRPLLLFLSIAQSFCRAQICPAQQTPSDALGPFYVQNSALTSNVGPELELADPLQRLEVAGRVLSSANCELGISGIVVEVWFAGPSGYEDDEYRGQVVTDSCGRYAFAQTFPALYASRPILHDHFRLSRDNEELLITQMYFEGTTEGFVTDADSRKMQVTQVSQNAEGVRSVEFNMYLDLEGDAKCDDEGNTTGTGNVTNGVTGATSDGACWNAYIVLSPAFIIFWSLILL